MVFTSQFDGTMQAKKRIIFKDNCQIVEMGKSIIRSEFFLEFP